MLYTNYSLDRDITISKFYLNTYPSYIEQKAEEKDCIVSNVNTDYSIMNSNLQYIGKITSQKYPLSMIKKDIKDLLKERLKYDVSNTHINEIKDDEERFTVFTMELTLDNPDYLKIIDEEYEISEELGLYEKNIILRLV